MNGLVILFIHVVENNKIHFLRNLGAVGMTYERLAELLGPIVVLTNCHFSSLLGLQSICNVVVVVLHRVDIQIGGEFAG